MLIHCSSLGLKLPGSPDCVGIPYALLRLVPHPMGSARGADDGSYLAPSKLERSKNVAGCSLAPASWSREAEMF